MMTSTQTDPARTSRAEKIAAGIYAGLWRVLAEWFDTPREPPELPRSARGGHYSTFKPAEGYLRYLKTMFWILAVLMDVGLLACWVVILVVQWWVALLLLPALLIVGIVPDIFGYVAVHLRYDTAWYVMTDRSVRIRRGVWIIQETTITFENVQNVSVRQGPVQRYFGIADVTIETAGSGASTGKHGNLSTANQGVIEGIDNAEEIRDLILSRLRTSKTAGLGDERREPDHGQSAGFAPAHVALLREIHSELTAINAT